MDEAVKIRFQWMHEFGYHMEDQKWIMDVEPPVDATHEQEELEAVRHINEINKTNWYDRFKENLAEIRKENGLPDDYRGIICTQCRKPVQHDAEGNGYCDHFDERPRQS